MKEKLVLSVLVDNESGVLQRVASLFSRRAYNISSLTVSETEDPNFSRMTIETNTEPENFRQIKRQLLKLEIVEKVSELTPDNSVSSELLLVKVHAQGIPEKNALLAFNAGYGARVLDISAETVTLEFTGAGEMLDAFIQRLEQRFSIVEMARTGVTSLGARAPAPLRTIFKDGDDHGNDNDAKDPGGACRFGSCSSRSID